MRCTVPLLSALALAGCTGHTTDDDVRQAWLVEAITDDNQIWFTRDSNLLAAKYARMAGDPFDYMRGTAGVSLLDWSRTTGDRQPTQFIRGAEAATVLIIGDPHLENVGTYLPGRAIEPSTRDAPIQLRLEITDFDGAGYGPWNLDTRRAALGLAIVLHDSACDTGCGDRVLEHWARTYTDAITGALGRPWIPTVPSGDGGIVDQLALESIEEGLLRKRLLEWTRPTASGRQLAFDRQLDPEGRGTRPISSAEREQLNRLLSQWQRAPAGFRVLDRGRRYGQGVSSIPAIRYVVLYDRGDDGPVDDALITIREVVDPAQIPGLTVDPQLRWDSSAARVNEAAHVLWSDPDVDAGYAALIDGDMTFKVVTASSFNEGLTHGAVIADSFESVDPEGELTQLAEILARQLAACHSRSHTWAGGSAARAIARDLGTNGARFVSETVLTAQTDLEQTLRDHRLFADALESLGPLLGADLLGVK